MNQLLISYIGRYVLIHIIESIFRLYFIMVMVIRSLPYDTQFIKSIYNILSSFVLIDGLLDVNQII